MAEHGKKSFSSKEVFVVIWSCFSYGLLVQLLLTSYLYSYANMYCIDLTRVSYIIIKALRNVLWNTQYHRDGKYR